MIESKGGRHLTIALGILAHGGAVIAADREQSDRTLKTDQAKIRGQWVAGRGSLAVSGAGNGPYLDSLTAELIEWFKNDQVQFDPKKFGEELRTKNHAFYESSVLPFAPYQEEVNYELLTCFAPSLTAGEIRFASKLGLMPQKECELWTSHKLSVVKEEYYAAVGCGATTAKALLARCWVPFIPLPVAINLACYVVYHVKRTVKDVGLDTDVMVFSGGIPMALSRDEITEMEAQFEEYGRIERENLYYCLGGDLKEHEELFGKPGDHKRIQKSLRKFFEKLNAKRVKRWTPKPPIPANTVQSVPQKSKPEDSIRPEILAP
jgi:hypothetical protein